MSKPFDITYSPSSRDAPPERLDSAQSGHFPGTTTAVSTAVFGASFQ